MQPKFVAAQKMLMTETQQTFLKWIASQFLLTERYAPLEARVCSQ